MRTLWELTRNETDFKEVRLWILGFTCLWFFIGIIAGVQLSRWGILT